MPSERKAREVASSPAWGLDISCKGRASISKGDLYCVGMRADMDTIYTISTTCQEKNALPIRFFRPFTKLRADQGYSKGLTPFNSHVWIRLMWRSPISAPFSVL